ncbi:MAG: hypothetical protein PHE24_04755 [Patescibacteria group bacterium]|nr:hypothetical protein [Patescibacteria group bacterium]
MFTKILGKITDSLGILAIAITFVAMFLSPVFSQETQIILSPNIQVECENMNNVVIQEEGVSVSEGTYIATAGQANVMPTATIIGIAHRTDTVNLSVPKIVKAKMVPLISDKEVAEIEFQAKAYLAMRKDRIANAGHRLPTRKEIQEQTKKELAERSAEAMRIANGY